MSAGCLLEFACEAIVRAEAPWMCSPTTPGAARRRAGASMPEQIVIPDFAA